MLVASQSLIITSTLARVVLHFPSDISHPTHAPLTQICLLQRVHAPLWTAPPAGLVGLIAITALQPDVDAVGNQKQVAEMNETVRK